MSASEFVKRIRDQADEPDRHYVLWLGAGCSVSSGIPAASALVRKQWLPRLHKLRSGDSDLDTWASEAFPGYDPENAGALYGAVMNALFRLPEDRQRETERLCSNQDPGFGYAVLAALMSRTDGILGTALTTNFDDMIADAMYVFGSQRPLVIQHDALASFARPGRVRRPLVIKVHGDHRLNPMHTASETAALEEGVRNGIRGLLQDRGLIFVGYSGNDVGVIEALQSLPGESLPLGVWWVSRTEPTGAIRTWLSSRGAVWVKAGSFDELMLLFHQEFQFGHPTVDKFNRMVQRYRDTYASLSQSVDELPESEPDSSQLKQAARRANDAAQDWWGVELEARRYRDTDPDRADAIYSEAIRQHPGHADLLGLYASFLLHVRGDLGQARHYFQCAIAAEPSDAINVGNLAVMLTTTMGDPDEADRLYELSRALDPDNPVMLTNHATFLCKVRGEEDRSEQMFQTALRMEKPARPYIIGNYATFLHRVRGNNARARALFEEAIGGAPEDTSNLANFARFLYLVDGDVEAARQLYERAGAAERQNAHAIGSYAWFLGRVGETQDSRVQFERALKLNPNHSTNIANFIELLVEQSDDGEAHRLAQHILNHVEGADRTAVLETGLYVLVLQSKRLRPVALAEARGTLAQGVRCTGKDFSGVLDRARTDGHPDIEWLERLAAVIADGEDPAVLEGWADWPSPSSDER